MNYLRRLIHWLSRAWPLFAVAALGFVHTAALALTASHTVMINKVTGTVMQVVGGLVVLHAVNGNLGLFREESLWAVVLKWLRDFPLRSKSTTIELKGAAATATAGSATLSVRRTATTIDEKLAELDRRIDEVQKQSREMASALHSRVDAVRSDLGSAIATNSADLRALAAKIERATVGGFKQQVFGVLLAIYGAVVSIFA